MKAQLEYSGDLKNDLLELNRIDSVDWEFMAYIDETWKPHNIAILQQFLTDDRHLVIISDCDADGLSALGVSLTYLSYAWREKSYSTIILGRSDRNPEAIINSYKNDAPNFLLLDCGTNLNIENIQVDPTSILVIDHHEPKNTEYQYHVINPKLYKVEHDEEVLSGAGLTYSCFSSLVGHSITAIQYAAIGTVADVVPMLHRNRWIVAQGILACNTAPLRLVEIFLKKFGKPITESDIAFYVAPAINAASRMNQIEIAKLGYVDNDSIAAQQLVELNAKRKESTEGISRNAKITELDKCVIIEINDGSEHAIASLVGNKLFGSTGKPTMSIIEREDHCTISLRTGTTLDAALFLFSLKLVTSGGHFGAAGGTVDKERKSEVIERFISYCNEFAILHQEYDADIKISPGKIYDAAEQMIDLAPFGNSFRKPMFLSKMKLIYAFRFPPGGKHIKAKFISNNYEFNAVLYNFESNLSIGKYFDIVYEISYNKQGQLELIVREIE